MLNDPLIQRRNGLALLSSPKQVSSHRIRLICAAKDLDIDIKNIDLDKPKLDEEVLKANPTGRIPALHDRDFVLFGDRVLAEYIDERFPHPALMPIEAKERAIIRLFSNEIEAIWYDYINQLEHEKLAVSKKKQLQKKLYESIIRFSPMFKANSHFLIGDELSLLDCCVLPAFWRLSYIGIEIPKSSSTAAMLNYMNYHFGKDYFKKSLSKYEKDLENKKGG